MKKILFLSALACAATMISCSSDDSSDSLPDNAKYIHKVNVINSADGTNETVTVNYNSDGTVSNITDGLETSQFAYNNGNLETVTGSSDALSISTLYDAPYDGYEYGEVLEYNGDGNPKKVRLFQRDYEGTIIGEYTSDITYDSQANPFLHMLDKAGILDVLDNVELNFSAVPNAEEIVMANELLFTKNPKSITVRDIDNNITDSVVANYIYDDEGYPTSATFTHTDIDGVISVSTATYTYLP